MLLELFYCIRATMRANVLLFLFQSKWLKLISLQSQSMSLEMTLVHPFQRIKDTGCEGR